MTPPGHLCSAGRQAAPPTLLFQNLSPVPSAIHGTCQLSGGFAARVGTVSPVCTGHSLWGDLGPCARVALCPPTQVFGPPWCPGSVWGETLPAQGPRRLPTASWTCLCSGLCLHKGHLSYNSSHIFPLALLSVARKYIFSVAVLGKTVFPRVQGLPCSPLRVHLVAGGWVPEEEGQVHQPGVEAPPTRQPSWTCCAWSAAWSLRGSAEVCT